MRARSAARLVGAHAEHAGREPGRLAPHHQARLGSRPTRSHGRGRPAPAERAPLRRRLAGRLDVAESAERGRAADGDHERPPAGGAQLRGQGPRAPPPGRGPARRTARWRRTGGRAPGSRSRRPAPRPTGRARSPVPPPPRPPRSRGRGSTGARRPSTRTSAPTARASARKSSSLRTLLPPRANPVRSSRLIHRRGPPRCAVRRGRGWSGVGKKPSGWRGGSAVTAWTAWLSRRPCPGTPS